MVRMRKLIPEEPHVARPLGVRLVLVGISLLFLFLLGSSRGCHVHARTLPRILHFLWSAC